MDLNLVNASVAAAGTFAMAVDEQMKDYIHWHRIRCENSDKYKELYEYDYLDLCENVVGVLVSLVRNGILIDICDGIAAYLDEEGIEHDRATHLRSKGREDVLKIFAEILLREGAIDEIFDRNFRELHY